jgi:hypothetical protein
MTRSESYLRRLGFGRMLYRVWHAPVGAVKVSIAAGGPLEQWRDRRAHAEMRDAAAGLPPQHPPVATDWPEVHFLTGATFWDQTALCLFTLQAHTGRRLRVVAHDDGTLTPAHAERLENLIPGIALRWRGDNDARVAALLPPDRFPFLHAERRRPHPNMLKLTDVHAGGAGWRLFLDSDMLFFQRPEFLIRWMSAPDGAVFLLDVAQNYGYPGSLMDRLAGARVPERLNSGMLGLESDSIDWERVEYWCRRFVELEGPRYYVEQALSAMLCAGRRSMAAPASEYRVFPSMEECRSPTSVLHHYVAGSKRGYYRWAWKAALERASATG